MRSGRAYPRRSGVARRTPRRSINARSVLSTIWFWGWKALLVILFLAAGAWLAVRYVKSSPTGVAEVNKTRLTELAGGEETEVTLFFATSDGQWLVPEKRSLAPDPDERAMAARLFETLKGGPVTPGLTATLSPSLQLREVYLTQDGLAIVDLQSPVAEEGLLGVSAERLAIYSIVNTLVDNLPGVNAVRFLVDGKEQETFMGHLDIRARLRPSRGIVREGRS